MNPDCLAIQRISDGQQLSVSLLNYGARIASIQFSGRELALTYADIQDYLSDPFYLGATIGPITNRVANAQLTINNRVFNMPANEGKNCLHSGGVGFDKALWTLTHADQSSVEYELDFDLSKLGMCGRLKTTARYSVQGGELTIDYTSECDTTTFINLTNHVYLNLSGQDASVEDHEFTIFAQSFVNVDQDSIPTGNITKLDSPMSYQLGSPPPFAEFNGLVDHHFNSDSGKLVAAKSISSGIQMEVLSNAPGFQFYTGKFLSEPFIPSSGFCVETQLAPDAINQPNFYSPELKPGELRKQTTTYRFSI